MVINKFDCLDLKKKNSTVRLFDGRLCYVNFEYFPCSVSITYFVLQIKLPSKLIKSRPHHIPVELVVLLKISWMNAAACVSSLYIHMHTIVCCTF